MKGTLIMGLLLTAVTVLSYGNGVNQAQKPVISESEGIFLTAVGQFEVYMLVESQREGNAGILVGVDEAVLQQYVPEGGFMHTANAFLIKAPGRNILVDSGTGAGGIILEKIKKLRVRPEQIETVLITHLHGDHFGGLLKGGEAAFPNAKVYLAAREYTHFIETQVNPGAAAALAPFGGNVETFEPAALGSTLNEIVPGIKAIASYGHTPGHTVFLVEDGGDKLIIAGDFLHVGLVQFARPDISASYDMDREEAAASRRQIIGYAAENKIPIGGMHVVYPGIGTVEADGDGFRFTPLE